MSKVTLEQLGLGSDDLSAIGKLSESGMTPEQVRQGIENGYYSTKTKTVIVGLNEVDDMTSIIQSYIDAANIEYLTSLSTRYYTHLSKIIVPAGRYKVNGLYLKSGVTIETIGNLIPLTSTSNIIYLAGSYIEIEGTLNIDCVDQANYNGVPISIDTTDATTVTLLTSAPFNRINYVTIENLNIKGNTTGTTSTGININSNGSTKGIAWIKINNGTIRDFTNDIIVTTSNGGYFNSNVINVSSNQCINGLKLNAIPGSEISNNEFNYTIQPRDVVNATGVTLLKANNNIFNGTIWDWKETYGLVVSDTGNNNTYGRGFIPSTFLHKTRILGQSSKVGDSFGSVDNFNIIYDHNETSHNALGWQDNILMYADKLFTTTVTPSKSSTFTKAFTPATAINHAWNTTWGTAGGLGEIQLTITDIPKFRFYAISLGFQIKTRIARAIKMEYQLDNGGWVTVYDVTDNLSTNVMYRTLGGSGYDANKLRFTFNTGVDATDPANPVAPSSNILAIQSIAVFGAGMRNFTIPTNLSTTITPEMFGAIGNGTTDDTIAINLALARTNQMVKLTGVGKYACNNIILNTFANIDLQLTNYNDADPILCINGADINLNKTIIDLRTGTYAGNCIELDTTKPWFTASSVARLKADDVQVYNWYGIGTGTGLSTAFKINITKQIFSSFWDITRFRSMSCKNGVVVTTSGTGYFTSNKFRHLQLYNFVDKPLYLESSANAEISANYFYMEMQPSINTLNGIKIVGGRFTKRNIIDGELWDWDTYVSNGNKVLEDNGWFTQLRHIDSNVINGNLTTINDGGNGFSLTPTKSLNIPTNAQGKAISGHADNYLAYANLRTGFTIVKSHAFNSGSDALLFSLDTYLSSSWTGLASTDVRTIEITLPTPISADAILISFQTGGVPKNVKLEYFGGATASWVTQVDKVNNTDTLVGRRGSVSSFSTGLTNTTKIRITLSDPYTYQNSADVLGWISTDKISIANIFLLSNQHKTISPYVDASVPILLGDLRSSKTVVQSISGLTQTKCLKVMDESGTLLGYMPLYI